MLAESSQLIVPVTMAVAAGLVGTVAVMRRMTLASDALSHLALPGVGVALLLHANPVVGGFAALFLGAVLVWALERETRIPTETIIGVLFSAALAVGSMLASGEELIDALFGAPTTPGAVETVFGVAAALAVVVFMWRAQHRLVVALVSADLARTSGVDVARLDLAFLLAFATTVALGLRYLGVLLMGSLIIIPAATAKQLARNLRQMRALSVGIAVLAMVIGTVGARRLHVDPGPLVITVAAGLFFVAVFLGRR